MSDDEQELENIEAGTDVGDVTTESSSPGKETERQKIQAEIDEFLKRGGQIKQIDSDVMSDPPKRPESNYGGQPI